MAGELKLIIAMKGRQKPHVLEVNDAAEAVLDLHEHLHHHGFSGWRMVQGLYLNMQEVQGFWAAQKEGGRAPSDTDDDVAKDGTP